MRASEAVLAIRFLQDPPPFFVRVRDRKQRFSPTSPHPGYPSPVHRQRALASGDRRHREGPSPNPSFRKGRSASPLQKRWHPSPALSEKEKPPSPPTQKEMPPSPPFQKGGQGGFFSPCQTERIKRIVEKNLSKDYVLST